MIHAWQPPGYSGVIRDISHNLYYRGEKVKKAIYRGNVVWEKESPETGFIVYFSKPISFYDSTYGRYNWHVTGNGLHLYFLKDEEWVSIGNKYSFPAGTTMKYEADLFTSIDFRGVNSLGAVITKVPKNNSITSFTGSFQACTSLLSIPDGMFDNCPDVTSFAACFQDCSSLVSIPIGLFDKCPNVTTFAICFTRCETISSIPAGLFDNCPDVESFRSTFSECSGITNIPTGLFDYCSYARDFSDCFRETLISSIPSRLFHNCPNINDVHRCFYKCALLTEIPQELFENCVDTTDFGSCFRYCRSLTYIPHQLFHTCVAANDFSYCFADCTAITSIPSDLFEYCRNVRFFLSTFYNCTRARGNAPNLWVTHSYANGQCCFTNCTNLTGYDDIPYLWRFPVD